MLKKTITLIIPVFCSIFLILSCSSVSSINVNYEHDYDVDFKTLKSYDWFPVPKKNIRHGLIINQIKHEINQQLKDKGISKISENPHLLIAIHGGIQNKMEFAEWQYLNLEYEQYWERRRVDAAYYHDEMIIVDIIDPKAKTLIYRATATTFTGIESTPEKRGEIITSVVEKILENFPPSKD